VTIFMQRRTLLISGAAAALAACGRTGGAQGQKVLKVGSQKGGTKALMTASGALAGTTYKIEWSEFAAAQPLLEAIAAGAVDVGAVGDAPFLFAFASGTPIKAVQASKASGGGSGTQILVRGGSPIRSAADLRGRKIATGRGSIGHYVLLRVLEREGIKPAEVSIVFLSPGDAKAAFSSGSIDAWATWGAFVAPARADGARTLADGKGILSGYGFDVAGPRAIADKRPQLEDFLRRLARAKRWVADHKAEYAAVLSKETGLAPEITAYTVTNTRSEPVPIDATVLAEQQRTLDGFRAAGALTATPDLASGFDASFNTALT
jgi:sulfonate transport system substrate-binding protein